MARKVAKKNHTWAVSLIRKHDQFPGYIKGPERKAAKVATVVRFNLSKEHRGRLVIQERANRSRKQ